MARAHEVRGERRVVGGGRRAERRRAHGVIERRHKRRANQPLEHLLRVG
jgi:hypothetical protein